MGCWVFGVGCGGVLGLGGGRGGLVVGGGGGAEEGTEEQQEEKRGSNRTHGGILPLGGDCKMTIAKCKSEEWD